VPVKSAIAPVTMGAIIDELIAATFKIAREDPIVSAGIMSLT